MPSMVYLPLPCPTAASIRSTRPGPRLGTAGEAPAPSTQFLPLPGRKSLPDFDTPPRPDRNSPIALQSRCMHPVTLPEMMAGEKAEMTAGIRPSSYAGFPARKEDPCPHRRAGVSPDYSYPPNMLPQRTRICGISSLGKLQAGYE